MPRQSPILEREKLGGGSTDLVFPSAFVNISACNFSFYFDGIALYIMYASLRALFIGWVPLNEKKKQTVSLCLYMHLGKHGCQFLTH